MGLCKNDIKRLARRAGVKGIKGDVYNEVRGQVQNFIDDIMKRTVTIIDYKKTQTVTPVDVVQGLHGVGQKIYI